MIELRSARITRPGPAPLGTRLANDDLAFRYLYTFRRIIVVLTLLGAGIAWAEQHMGLFAAFVCVGIGELIECSYYLGVVTYSTQRSDRNAARISSEKSAGSSHAAKCPPLSTWWK
jgi:hypothetical protein